MTAIIKVKVQRKAVVKLKVLPKFPSTVVGDAGIIVTKSAGSYTFSLDPVATLAVIGLTPGVNVQAQDADLQALANNAGTGIWAVTGAGTGHVRTIAGTANEITLTNGDGVAGNPAVSLPAALTFTGKTVTGGTFSAPTISGGSAQLLTTFSLANSGFSQFIAAGGTLTGNHTLTVNLNNTDSIVTLNGNANFSAGFALSGGFATTFTTTGVTSVTFPTAGTLATLAGAETFTNKTITSPTINGGTHQSITSLSLANSGFQQFIATSGAITANRSLAFNMNDTAATISTNGNVTFAGQFVTSGASACTINVTGSTNITLPTAGTLATTSNNLGAFSATTSAQLAGVISDETGTGPLVFATNPTLTTPALGTPSALVLTNATGLPLSGHTTQAAFTFVGNNTSGTAVPTAVDIAALTAKASPAATDLILLSDQAASGAWKKATVSSVAAAGSVSSIAGNTGAFTLSTGITNSANDIRLNRGHLPGETTTGSAASGEIGEYIESIVLAGSAISPSSTTAANITSISLTAGDWDVRALGEYSGGATTTVGFCFLSISTTTATIDTTPGHAAFAQVVSGNTPFSGGNEFTLNITPLRVSLSGTTTVFLVTRQSYAVSTMSANGIISARRMR